jgi:putative acetyltransferase
MINLRRPDSDDPDFKAMVKLLDADLAIRDGADHGFYSQFNQIDKIRHAVVCYENGQSIGCGAIKAFNDEAMEVKRMYVSPDGRNKGIATRVLAELEAWASEMGYLKCVLETGKRQPEAIALYEKNGYRRTENYGQYVGVENSVCFAKVLGG